MSPCEAGVTIWPVTGIGEIRAGDDLGVLLPAAFALRDDDVLAVTSKVVSKAEGRVLATTRDAALAGETARVVARRGATAIVRTHQGLVMAAAGIDESNTARGTVVLLPLDADASARRLREQIASDHGVNVAVLVTDTFGRAWRHGQTDVAIGAAGLAVLRDYRDRPDGYGNLLAVTAPAVADELAGAADLVKAKLARAPAAVVRGLSDLVAAPGEHGTGAQALVREEAHDMFGYGAREAVLAAVRQDPRGQRAFGAAASADELTVAMAEVSPRGAIRIADDRRVDVLIPGPEPGGGTEAGQRAVGAQAALLAVLAHAMGWFVDAPPAPVDEGDLVLRFRALRLE